MDLLYVGLIVAFFALTWGLAVVSDALAPAPSPAGKGDER